MNALAYVLIGPFYDPLIAILISFLIVYLITTLLPIPGNVKNVLWVVFGVIACILLIRAFV